MSTMDPFGRTDLLDERTLEALVVRFEARGAHPHFSRMMREYLDAMRIDEARLVLDLGCGTGVVARAIAHRPGFSGRAVGVDLSPHLIAAAQQLARQEGITEGIEFRTGDAGALPESERYDAVIAHTLLSHVDDALKIVNEAARVLKPGGMLGIFDGDYASLTFGHEDQVRAKAYDDALISAVVANPRVMRQMPRLLRAAGLEFVTSCAYVLAEVASADFWLSAIKAYRRLIPESGVMTQHEADEWSAALHRDADEGVFFGSCNYYAYVARRPAE